jgi:DNA-binding FadR family transcriptional regulator
MVAAMENPPAPQPAKSREQRQRRCIVEALCAGDHARATALAHEHLMEFPHDETIRAVLDEL